MKAGLPAEAEPCWRRLLLETSSGQWLGLRKLDIGKNGGTKLAMKKDLRRIRKQTPPKRERERAIKAC